MKLAYTIHEILLKDRKPATPHQVIELNDKQFADLEKLGAVRTPTETEIAIYNSINAPKKAAVDVEESDAQTKPAAKRGRKPKAAAETNDSSDDNTTTDPDEVSL